MTPRELEQAIRSLMEQPMADAELREQLEQLAAAEISFSGFTWLMALPKWNVEVIHWKGGKAKILDNWLAEVDKNDEARRICFAGSTSGN